MSTELSIIKYYKCGHCGVVRSKEDWDKATLEEFGHTKTDPICPSCNTMNIGSDESIPGVTTWTPIVAPFTKTELDELNKIKKEKSELEKKEKKLSPKVKEFLINNNIKEFLFEDHKMTITYQDRSAMDEDKLVSLIKSVLTQDEIEQMNALKQISNPGAVKQLLVDGKINMEQLFSCKIPNLIPVFNLNPKERKEKDEKAYKCFGEMF